MRSAQRLIALAIVCSSVAAMVRAEEPTLPTPPQQTAPWAPPETRLPRFLVTAAQALFDQGLADPRGCEYRAIRIQVRGRGGQEVSTTSGWVLPAEGDGPRHAVAWSGLVYPLAGVDEPADLESDVAGMRSPDVPGPGFGFRGFNGIGRDDEYQSIAVDYFHPIRVCLLLRLGRADLAEALWTSAGHPLAAKPTGPGPNLDLRNYGVSYLTLATDFAWFRYNRAVTAHLRADDALALADARALDAFWRAVDAKAAEMGFTPPPRPAVFAFPNPQRAERVGGAVPKAAARPPAPGLERASRYINFLDQAPALLADQERRARERANPLPPAPAGDEITPLIRALDQIAAPAARPGMQNNGLAVDQSAAVRDLVALGDAAVEPLIQDLRTDNRLTRALGLNVGVAHRARTIARADEAAYHALRRILKVSSLGPPSLMGNDGEPVDRNALADQLQEYWDKNKDIPLVERWYRMLADDQAGAGDWSTAAGNIVVTVNSQAPPVFPPGPVPAERPILQGEALREGHSPSVTELLIRRIESLRKPTKNWNFGIPQPPTQLAEYLAIWDPDAALPTLRGLTLDSREWFAQAVAANSPAAQSLALAIVRFTSIRDRLGDESALDEYAAWIKTPSFKLVEPFTYMVLEPIRTHPEHPKLSATADWLFSDPQSPWAILWTEKGAKPAVRLGHLITSQAIEIPAFRRLVQSALADDTVVGKAEVRDGGLVDIKFDDGSGMGGTTLKDLEDPDAPPIGAKADVRARDFYAWRLAARGGALHFNPCWPQAKRDAAFAEIVESLKREAP